MREPQLLLRVEPSGIRKRRRQWQEPFTKNTISFVEKQDPLGMILVYHSSLDDVAIE
jgi:hypothetical protein